MTSTSSFDSSSLAKETPPDTQQTVKEEDEEAGANNNANSVGTPNVHLPRIYANANDGHDLDIEHLKIAVEPADDWKVYQRIGRGKYSEVFEGKNMKTQKIACIKILKPCVPKLLKLEIYTLQYLANGPNIIQLLHTLQDEQSNLWCLVFEILQCQELKDMLKTISPSDFCYYMYECLRGMDFAHSKGVIHRDIKPQNILIDTAARQLRLIDWGLAAFYYPNHAYSVRVCTRAYKAPELLLEYKLYNYAIDLWAFGCMLAGVVFNKQYFFHGKDFPEQMLKIMEILGTDALDAFLSKYEIRKPDFIVNGAKFKFVPAERRDLKSLINQTWSENKMKFINDDVIDLIDKLLRYDPQQRLTAREAMQHKYFDSVRNSGGITTTDADDGDGSNTNESEN